MIDNWFLYKLLNLVELEKWLADGELTEEKYDTAYRLGMTTTASAYNVHLTAQNTSRSAQELYITIDKKTYRPTQVKMREGKTWTTIAISNFQAKDQADGVFVFRSKDFPDAEVIDLR